MKPCKHTISEALHLHTTHYVMEKQRWTQISTPPYRIAHTRSNRSHWDPGVLGTREVTCNAPWARKGAEPVGKEGDQRGPGVALQSEASQGDVVRVGLPGLPQRRHSRPLLSRQRLIGSHVGPYPLPSCAATAHFTQAFPLPTRCRLFHICVMLSFPPWQRYVMLTVPRPEGKNVVQTNSAASNTSMAHSGLVSLPNFENVHVLECLRKTPSCCNA